MDAAFCRADATPPMPPMVLCFSAHDSSCGAGAAADIQTALRCSVYPLSVATAITAQNFNGLQHCHALPAKQITQQFNALRELPIRAVKVGVVARHHRTVAACIRRLRKANSALPVVVDPVLAPSYATGKGGSASAFIQPTDYGEVLATLLPLADVITPNRAELLALTAANTLDDAISIACKQYKIKNIVISDAVPASETDDSVRKVIRYYHSAGGKISGYSIFYYNRQGDAPIHGSGCRFSTALACALARGDDLPQAICHAGETVQAMILHRFATGQKMQGIFEPNAFPMSQDDPPQ